MTIEHRNIADADLHEVKGAATASSGQVLVADGFGTTSFIAPANIMGWWDYNDLATSTTPVDLTLAGTFYPLPNDGAGPFTNINYTLDGVSNIWNTTTGVFDFSSLELGDTIGMRCDVEFTTSGANHDVHVVLELAQSTSPYEIIWADLIPKTAGTYRLTTFNKIYMGDNNTLNGPAQFKASSGSTGDTVKVNGWFVEVSKRGTRGL